MATADSVKTKIQGLITKANNTTGRSDADMTNAVDALVEGYNPDGIIPSGTKSITANGTHDVTTYASASVNVPIPSGYVKPSGTLNITANGTHDVTNYASASVNVPIPSGYIKPSGSLNITTNGTHTVTNYASAVVNVPTPPEYTVVRTITLSSDVTNTEKVLLTADPFIAANYANENLMIYLYPNTQIASAAKVVHSLFQTNRNNGSTNVAKYGWFYYSTGASAIGFMNCGTKLSGSGYNTSLRTKSTGNLNVWISANYIIKAGTYTLIMTCTS